MNMADLPNKNLSNCRLGEGGNSMVLRRIRKIATASGRFRRGSKYRAGVSLLELEVAFVVFGIALSGLAPLVVMHLRQVEKLEQRLNASTTYYLTPSSDSWARKLGAAATISSTAPTVTEGVPTIPVNAVQILSLDKSFAGEEVTSTVSVIPIPQ
jgi:hypothetical protein